MAGEGLVLLGLCCIALLGFLFVVWFSGPSNKNLHFSKIIIVAIIFHAARFYYSTVPFLFGGLWSLAMHSRIPFTRIP